MPLPASPTSPRELSLTHYSINFFGEYRILHSYLSGVNISRCHPAAKQNDVRFVREWVSDNPSAVAYIANRDDLPKRKNEPKSFVIDHKLVGYKSKANYLGWDYDRVSFPTFCADWTAGGAVTFGIRDNRSQTIEQFVANAEGMSRQFNRFAASNGSTDRSEMFPTEKLIRGPNTWTHVHNKSPTAPGMDEGEDWMLPIGNSNYYLYLSFGYISGARAANGAEDMRTRALVEQIIDTVRIEKISDKVSN